MNSRSLKWMGDVLSELDAEKVDIIDGDSGFT
jgi:hypothetical protein